MRLSVIIPAYNEEKRLPTTLRAVDEYLRAKKYNYEILVVSDGSQDKTVDVVHELTKEIPHLRLIENPKNHGKGYVVRQGMLEAEGEYRLFMDADNATSIDHMEKVWPQVEAGYDVVICSRDIEGSVLAVPQTWLRRRLGDVFNLIVQAFSGLWGMWDTQCGFKVFSAKAAEDIFHVALVDRWAFDVELLVIAKIRGYEIKEIPTTWVNSADSKVRVSGMVKMLMEVFDIYINMIRGKYNKEV